MGGWKEKVARDGWGGAATGAVEIRVTSREGKRERRRRRHRRIGPRRRGRGRTLIVAFPQQTRDDGPRDPVVVNQQHVHVRGGAGRHGDRASRQRSHAQPPKNRRRGPRAPRDARHARSRSQTRDGRRGTLGRGPRSARPSLVRDQARGSAPARAKQWCVGRPRPRSREKGGGTATSSAAGKFGMNAPTAGRARYRDGGALWEK